MGGIVRRAAGIRADKRLVHLFAMLPPAEGRPLFIGDAAVNVAPDVKTRIEVALHIAEMARRLGQVGRKLPYCQPPSRYFRRCRQAPRRPILPPVQLRT